MELAKKCFLADPSQENFKNLRKCFTKLVKRLLKFTRYAMYPNDPEFTEDGKWNFHQLEVAPLVGYLFKIMGQHRNKKITFFEFATEKLVHHIREIYQFNNKGLV